ncbi:MAG: amino acid ABC transporter ATP-binding protein [Vampirovibrionales bacterium]|nr:amino acid ABC transporter ATP-binding protein [Vampirovibrionales bacterium]
MTSLPPPILTLDGVEKSFGGQPALCGFSLSVAPGETLVLMGSSGCGKTTALRCINALEVPERGDVRFRGAPVHAEGTNLQRLRTEIGMVFQQFNLFPHMTVLENLTLGPTRVTKTPPETARDTAYALLRRIGLADRAHSYPDRLSGGQQQRVAIARALAMAPSLILLDEPTSALDPRMAGEVRAMIADVAAQGVTLVLASHSVRLAETIATRVAFVDRGRVIEQGPPQQILVDPQQAATRAFLEGVSS